MLSAPSQAALIAKLERLALALGQHEATPVAAIAAALARDDLGETCRLALVAKDARSLAKSIEQALQSACATSRRRAGRCAAARSTPARLMPASSRSCSRAKARSTPGMLGDLAMCFGEVQQWLDFWHTLYAEPRGDNRTDIAFPHASEMDDASRKKLDARLHDMDVGSEAVFVAGMAMHALLRSLGVEPDVMMGHSSGESTALAASGAMPAETPLELAAFVRELNAVYEQVLAEGKIPTGALLAVGALSAEAVQEQHRVDRPRTSSSPWTTVPTSSCSTARRRRSRSCRTVLIGAGAICMPLPFDRGYHTPHFADVSAAFAAYYGRIKLRAPRVPLYSCASAGLFPATAAGVRKLAAAQWSQKVRFRETIEQMVADGVGCFVEVGPSGNLTAFVSDIPAGKAQVSIASNLRRRNGVEQLLTVLAQLYASGRPVRLQSLFDGRRIAAVDLAKPVDSRPYGVLLDNTMPMIRYSDLDREALRTFGGPASAAPPVAGLEASVVVAREPETGAVHRHRSAARARSARRRHGRVFRRHARLPGAAAGGRRVVASLVGRNGRA